MIAPIMGSETEFGLLTRERPHGRDGYFLILNKIYEKLRNTPIVEHEKCDSVLKNANWWREDLSRKEWEDSEMRSDALRRMGLSGEYLANGGRFYVDGHHLEYSTPECSDPWELVAHEKAGEIIAKNAVLETSRELGLRSDLLKRNSDYGKNVSYACHENYLLNREFFERLVSPLGAHFFRKRQYPEQAWWVLHLISRQIFTGSGCIVPRKDWPQAMGLSQRQPFILNFIALDTTGSRSIINTRDRPYADNRRFARLHVICGDSNRADLSNILKYGTSRLLLSALEDFRRTNGANLLPMPDNPVRDFRNISGKHSSISTNIGMIKAIDAQKMLLEFARKWYESAKNHAYSWAPRLFALWQETLDMLHGDDEKLARRLDFFIKKKIFEGRFAKDANYPMENLHSLEYNYHLVGKDSLFDRLAGFGEIENYIGKDEAKMALISPPKTRAELRSNLLRLYGEESGLYSAWHVVGFFAKSGKHVKIVMPDPSSATEHSFSDREEP